MRKDVKLGFAIGGVLLAVLIVYVIVVPGGGEQKRLTSATDPSQTKGGGAKVTLEPVPSANNGATTRPAGAVAQGQPPAVPPPVYTPPATDPFEPANTTAGTNTTVAKGDTAKTQAASSNGLDWNKLLNEQPAVLMSTGGRPAAAAANTPATPAPDSTASAAKPGDSSPGPDVTQPGPTPPTSAVPPATPGTSASATADTSSTPSVPTVPPPAADGTSSTVPPTSDPTVTSPQAPVAGSATASGISSESATAGRTHTVQLGETMSSIAIAAYGNANFYPAIMRANPTIDPTRLRPGMKLTLPPIADVKPSAGSAAANTNDAVAASGRIEQPIDPTKQYRVAPGDSLYKISQRLYGRGDRADKIHQANKATMGDDPHRLKVGQVLQLPDPPTATGR